MTTRWRRVQRREEEDRKSRDGKAPVPGWWRRYRREGTQGWKWALPDSTGLPRATAATVLDPNGVQCTITVRRHAVALSARWVLIWKGIYPRCSAWCSVYTPDTTLSKTGGTGTDNDSVRIILYIQATYIHIYIYKYSTHTHTPTHLPLFVYMSVVLVPK